MTFFSLFSLYCEEQDFVTFKKQFTGEGPSARALCPGRERQSHRSKVECPDNRAFPGVTNEKLISVTAEMSWDAICGVFSKLLSPRMSFIVWIFILRLILFQFIFLRRRFVLDNLFISCYLWFLKLHVARQRVYWRLRCMPNELNWTSHDTCNFLDLAMS